MIYSTVVATRLRNMFGKDRESGSANFRVHETSSLLMVGNFLSNELGTRSVCEDLADALASNGWNVFRTSTKKNRWLRFANMIFTTIDTNTL